MRYRYSASNSAPVCYVQAAAHAHASENKRRKTFTYVAEQDGESHTLKGNIEELASTLEALVLSLSNCRDVKRLAGMADVYGYSLKSIAFDIEEQLKKCAEAGDAEAAAEAGRADIAAFAEKMLKCPRTGEIRAASGWKEYYESTKQWNPDFLKEWGGESFEDRGLVEVERDGNGNWVEK